ncbi:hypothetical protein [Pseudomonas sp. PS01301]|uniref:hypothetical protein n=1 Tax=Pseudomonas sp. PS01301 TaxID=2991437 RepID=UPI00249C8491|nr:hypothetical protein [Pseudomonas sp. PS01301]
MTQLSRVLEILETSSKPLALFEIKAAILERFRQLDSEAGISARIRNIRHRLENDGAGTVRAEKAENVSWYRYRLQRNTTSNAVITPV